MQGLADGYFVIPYTHRRLPRRARRCRRSRPTTTRSRRPPTARRSASTRLLGDQGQAHASARFHRELGRIMWDDVGMARNEAGLQTRARQRFRSCARSSGRTSSVPGDAEQPEPEPRVRRPRRRLPGVRASCWRSTRCTATNRAAATSARRCQTPDGEALRDDEHYSYVAAWEFTGVGPRADAAQGAAGVRGSAPDAAELQVDRQGDELAATDRCSERLMRRQPESLAAGRARRSPAGSSTTRPTTSRPTCRSSRCSTSSTKS